jgi:hypothetical protein
MEYKGKAVLTLRCLLADPRQMTVATNVDVSITPKDNHVVIAVKLAKTVPLVSELDVSIQGETHRFVVDSTTHLDTQYVFHCFPAKD